MFPHKYPDLAAPVAGNVFLRAHTATAARFEVPETWKDEYVTISSTQSDLYVLLGDAGVMIESAEALVAVSETLASNWASGFVIPAGASATIPFPRAHTHFAVDSSAANGVWTAFVASGNPASGEQLNTKYGNPILWLDAGERKSIALTSGAITVAGWKSRVTGYEFVQASAKPDWFNAAQAAAGLIRPSVSFITGSSEYVQCTDATLAAALGSANAFTLAINFSRGATGAAHTLFSVGTTGSNNGRWDVSFDASDDLVITRVDSAGNSTTSTYAMTASGAYSLVITFDGATPLAWLDGTSISLTGTAAGDVGTATKVTVGARAYNTATIGQYANAEICSLIVFPTALSGGNLTDFQAWFRRRTGK